MTQRQADYKVGLPQTADKVRAKLSFSTGALSFMGGGEQHLRISTMLAWATLPANTHRNRFAKRRQPEKKIWQRGCQLLRAPHWRSDLSWGRGFANARQAPCESTIAAGADDRGSWRAQK
jgi:hypothetical protein